MLDKIIQIDSRWFLQINGLHNETWDTIMVWISGKYTWLPFYIALLVYLAWRKRWALAPMLLFIALTVVITDQTSVHLFKNVFHRLRPCHQPSLEGLVHTVNGKCGGLYGFVSSHAANVMGIAALIFLWTQEKGLGVVLFLWAGAVCYSRIYLGVHFPLDVLAGAYWGMIMGTLVFLAWLGLMRLIPSRWWIHEERTDFRKMSQVP